MIVGRLVHLCTETGETLDSLPLSQFRAVSSHFDADIYEALDMKRCVEGRKAIGGPAPSAVAQQIASVRAFVREREAAQ